MNNTIFISGIHGVGKSYLSEQLIREYPNVIHLTASQILKQKLMKDQVDINKKVKNIDHNQQVLVETFNMIRKNTNGLIVFDGHFVLINQNGDIERINIEVFKALNLKALVLLVGSIDNIYERLQSRDKFNFNKRLLKEMQEEEIKYSTYLANELKLPLTTINVDNTQDALRKLSIELVRYI